MTVNIGQIRHPEVLINPSEKLKTYMRNIKVNDDAIPSNIKKYIFKNISKDEKQQKSHKTKYFVLEDDKKFIKSLNLPCMVTETQIEASTFDTTSDDKNDKSLTLQDLYWLYEYVTKENEKNDTKTYLHELMEKSQIILPKNEEIPRSQELENRCEKLRTEQSAKEYEKMTKNVDNTKRRLPEDTIGYQIKMMNKHLIVLIQFVITVATGFAFGFMGIETLVGSMSVEVKLVLGIICAVIVAIAELYFIIKKLNEEIEIEENGIRT